MTHSYPTLRYSDLSDIEPECQILNPAIGLQLFLRLFLFRIVRNDTQLPEGELQLDAAVFFVGQDRRALQGGTQGVAIDQHFLVRTNRDYRVVIRETAINQLAGERDVLAMDAQVVAAHLQFHAAVTTFKQAL